MGVIPIAAWERTGERFVFSFVCHTLRGKLTSKAPRSICRPSGYLLLSAHPSITQVLEKTRKRHKGQKPEAAHLIPFLSLVFSVRPCFPSWDGEKKLSAEARK